MDDETPVPYTAEEHALHIAERTALIEAARESARTFDQAVLAFGSAIFAASIAFLKDVAPNPQSGTIKWLGISWGMFAGGLLFVLLSFLFSHKACMRGIEISETALLHPKKARPKNEFSNITDWCNYLCVGLLFLGILSWIVFAFGNVGKSEKDMSNPPKPAPVRTEDRGYTPPRNPPPPPPPTQPAPPAPKK
jgi:hypothetical protein